MQLLRACELLIEARDKGNQVDFWRGVGLIGAALQEINKIEEQVVTGRFKVERRQCMCCEVEVWVLLDDGEVVLEIEQPGDLRQLVGVTMLANLQWIGSGS